MSKALEFACEQVVIELMGRSSVLSGFPMIHDDADIDSKAECIVVKAEAGEKQYEGASGFPVEVTATFRTNFQNASRSEGITEAMVNSVCIVDKTITIPAFSFFDFLSIEQGGGSSRENEPNLRKRVRQFSFIAKEKA